MELTFDLIDALWRPGFILSHRRLKLQIPTNISWEESALNPKNRVDSLPEAGVSQSSSRWRIDGSATFKTRFYAIPLDLLESDRLPPLRIDVFLPDQGTYPPALRQTLNATTGLPLQHPPAIAALGISRYVCQVLDLYCSRNPSFLRRYLRLPFGSRIIINNVVSNMDNVDVTVQPNYTLEGLTTPINEIHEAWARANIPVSRWPPTINLVDLRLVRQLHDSVTLVKVLECKERPELQGITAIFKSGSDDFYHVLHELNLLLILPQHSHIITPPLAIVTKKSSFGGKQGVYGFLIPYLPSGSFRDMLPSHSLAQKLDLTTKIRWCIEVTSALIHVFEKGKTFFSDLRPDNVLLDKVGHAVLCDFEQRGSWHEWCPPEVLYPQYVESLLNSQQGSRMPGWDSLLLSYTRKRPTKIGESYVYSKNRPWFALSRQSQEKAMVYTLGLFIYCVFEGLSSVSPSLRYRFAIDPDISFPVFRRTPTSIQSLIRQCTSDAPLWHETKSLHRRKVVRIGSLVYTASATHQPSHSEQSPESVLDTALEWWTTELENARQFFLGAEWERQQFGGSRPSLQYVIDTLQSYQNEGASQPSR